MTPRLKLNRLSVHRGKASILYDQEFHEGVNIIHGDNGSGKSTIADFIYFALGGDLREWRKEAALADHVVAEISAGEAVLTLRRDVSETSGRPMQIFFGPYADAMSDVRGWESFPYRRPEAGYSFSQVLFKAIGIPEAVSDGLSNMTMHQLLRVLYSDQLTPIQRIFRVESFDTWQTRQAVGDLLCGLGGYDLYALQLFLREHEKKYSDASSRLKSLITVATSYGDQILIEHVKTAIANTATQREGLQQRLMVAMSAVGDDPATEAEALLKNRRRTLARARAEVLRLAEQIEVLEYEQTDAEQFIDHLQASVADFEDASATFFALGSVRFEFCPSCFTRLAGSHDHHQHQCHLCGSPADTSRDETRALAVRLDLEMQINESKRLQDERALELTNLKLKLRGAKSALRAASGASELDRVGTSAADSLVADLSRQIGYLDREMEQLQARAALADEIAALSEEKSLLNARISELKDKIAATEGAQRRRRQVSYTAVADNIKRLLERDLQQHSDFGEVESVSFDFSEDWIAINGDKNRVGSASGMVVLKNSFLLSLFVASLYDRQFNLPRFMLMDNIEDKGMVQERSWNFQRLIVEASKDSIMAHQIIFSTSKIAPELEESPLVVGGKYTKERRTLKIVG